MEKKAFTIEIAGLPAKFFLPSCGAFYREIRDRYRPFISTAGPGVVFDVEFKSVKTPRFKPIITRKKGSLRFMRGDFDCFLDLSSLSGAMQLYPKVQSFDSFLRTFYSWWLMRSGGIMLHSAGIVKDNEAYLFLGRSGAGKSTLSKLAVRRAEVVSDELNIVRYACGRWMVFGSPFWGEMRQDGRQGGWPLGGLFLLGKSRINKVQSCPKAGALRRILRCMMSFSGRIEGAVSTLNTVWRLLVKVEPRELLFSKADDSFLNLI